MSNINPIITSTAKVKVRKKSGFDYMEGVLEMKYTTSSFAKAISLKTSRIKVLPTLHSTLTGS